MKSISVKKHMDLTALRLLFSLVSICCAGSLVSANGMATGDSTQSVAPIEVKAKDDLKFCPAPYSPGYCKQEDQSRNNKCEQTSPELLKILDRYPYVTANFDLACTHVSNAGRS